MKCVLILTDKKVIEKFRQKQKNQNIYEKKHIILKKKQKQNSSQNINLKKFKTNW